ncbi:hypothetical protein BVRB_1g017330 [Beta vulgaris subsp. vulgaris]|nr:hypothetical protein BVRB_1g017330 [Beta vulgaris subsp. vulgaris]
MLVPCDCLHVFYKNVNHFNRNYVFCFCSSGSIFFVTVLTSEEYVIVICILL